MFTILLAYLLIDWARLSPQDKCMDIDYNTFKKTAKVNLSRCK